MGSGSDGINPLVIGMYMVQCFDDAKACERGRMEIAKPESFEPCRAIGKPGWHCYSIGHRGPTSDPLNNTSTCYPSAAICALSRPSPWDDDDEVVIGACIAAQTVYCYVASSGSTSCFGDDMTCKLAKDRLKTVLGSSERVSECTQRH